MFYGVFMDVITNKINICVALVCELQEYLPDTLLGVHKIYIILDSLVICLL